MAGIQRLKKIIFKTSEVLVTIRKRIFSENILWELVWGLFETFLVDVDDRKFIDHI